MTGGPFPELWTCESSNFFFPKHKNSLSLSLVPQTKDFGNAIGLLPLYVLPQQCPSPQLDSHPDLQVEHLLEAFGGGPFIQEQAFGMPFDKDSLLGGLLLGSASQEPSGWSSVRARPYQKT